MGLRVAFRLHSVRLAVRSSAAVLAVWANNTPADPRACFSFESAEAILARRPSKFTFLVLSGKVVVDGDRGAGEGDLAIFAWAQTDAQLLAMDGEPFAEPVVGHGPFVMNSRAEIDQAFEDYLLGRLGELA